MTEPLYRIAPLKWDSERDGLVYSSRSIDRSTYYVRSRDFKWDAYVQCGGGHGGSGQSFGSFLDLETAQAACQSHWEQTLIQYLEEVDGDAFVAAHAITKAIVEALIDDVESGAWRHEGDDNDE